jgi:AcrR family transcriptional regulator
MQKEKEKAGPQQEALEKRLAAGESVKKEDFAAAMVQDAAATRIAAIQEDRRKRTELGARLDAANERYALVRADVEKLSAETEDGHFEELLEAVGDAVTNYLHSITDHNRKIQHLRLAVERVVNERAVIQDELAKLDGDDTSAVAATREHVTDRVEIDGIDVHMDKEFMPRVQRVVDNIFARARAGQ